MRVRFNLGRGENFRKWQVSSKDDKVHYDPYKVQMELQYCILCNKREISNDIFNGSHKRVCSWINVKDTKIHPLNTFDVSNLKELKYNPRESPYWTDEIGNDLDYHIYSSLVTDGNKIYILKNII